MNLKDIEFSCSMNIHEDESREAFLKFKYSGLMEVTSHDGSEVIGRVTNINKDGSGTIEIFDEFKEKYKGLKL